MAPKRRPADNVSLYTSSESDLEGSSPRRSKKRRRRSRAGAGAAADSSSEDEARPLRVYIVQAKLTPDAINELYQLVEDFASSHPETEAMEMELCSDAKKADIVVTAVHMKPRLERHIDWSIAIIKSYPNVITKETFEADVSKLPGMGGKIAFKVEEYLQTGSIPEAQTTLASERYQALSTFVSIYGIGPAKARQFYDMDEVEEIRDVVMRELEDLQPDCVSTIVGGYRRGKPQSNDVDIVISHSDPIRGKDIIPGLCKRLTARLYKKGLVTHVMHLSGFHSLNALRTEHWDTLEKALTVFKLPPKPGIERLHRRLDLIFALPDTYWTAVIGWTGSKMFQRDLRLWAKKEKGMKFDSVGLTRRHDTRRYLPKSEKEVFDILGLPWIDPTMRNADA
ncbi:hypothetical protein H1R20_g12822, partial [Candolleomyces eurysporus]